MKKWLERSIWPSLHSEGYKEKREQQLREWDKFETSYAESTAKKAKKIKFDEHSVLVDACFSDDGMQELKEVLQNGADGNSVDNTGRSALHKACCRNYIDPIRVLVEHGVDVNKKDEDGVNALHIASVRDYIPIAQDTILWDHMH